MTSTLPAGADILGAMPQRVSATVMVGRDAPLDTLRGSVAALAATGGRVVVVGGEAGAGKTRLVTEFVDGLGEGTRVLLGGCLELGEALLPLAPLAGILRQLGQELGDEQAAAEVGPELAAFLPGRSGGNVESLWSGQASLFEAFSALLDRLSSQGPLVLVLEDLHWADRSTLDLLTWLSRTVVTSPVLLVATYRSDEMRRSHPLRAVLAEMSRLPQVERLELEPLGEADVVALLNDIQGDALPAELTRQVVERSEGNPFFAEELLAAVGSGSMPLTLRDILSARLDKLPEPAKEVLRIAAAAGRRVDHRLLEVVASLGPDELDAGLRSAVEEQALVAESDGFRFRHALLQEAVHEQLLPGERTRLARSFADALLADPSLAGGGAAAVDAELAHHAAASHDLDLAFTSLVRAGRRARSLFAFNEARRHYQGAIELAGKVSADAAASVPPTWELLRAAAFCCRQSGEPAIGVGHLRQAISLLDEETDRVAIGGLYAELSEGLWINGEGDEALVAAEEGVRLLTGYRTREAAEAFGFRARLLMLLGRFDEAVEPGRLGVEIAREVDAPLELSRAENALGTSLASLGEIDEGLPRLKEAIEIGRRNNIGADTVRGYINLVSSLKTPIDDVAQAEVWAREGMAFAKEHGITGSMCDWLRMEYGDVLIRLGRWAEAEDVLTEVRTGFSTGVSGLYFEVSHGLLAVTQGNLEEAEDHLRRSHELAPIIRDPQAIAPQVGVRMLIELGRGRHEVGDAIDLLAPHILDAQTYGPLALTARVCTVAALAGDPSGITGLRRIQELFEKRSDGANAVQAGNIAGWLSVVAAEIARAEGKDDPELWAAALAAMTERVQAEHALYAGVRLADALGSADRLDEATEQAGRTHQAALAIGAVPLAAEVEMLARKHRLKLPGIATTQGAAGLTGREREVLRLVGQGRTNREIGTELFISEKTASVHVSNILAKLGAANRGEAAAIGRDRGI
ncbi:helix-turn-helix transcriptional regulator [Nocardioides marmorisolisilvae]|uniref:LuxR family transcriptional regulator n=1 Tax=Nocardioides marmorisolisilvae TaxID=1542737 RepID=A0A3N0DU58_9ACTN|nr:LuxR family transcriptional regulator [Nocardioides marmorisolisilvae]RNL79026.1 LuxR family transcriptional regulator [Nocardioides marmorisolisilvae]